MLRKGDSIPLPEVKHYYSAADDLVMTKTAVVSSKGQITLPKELRTRHHLEEGATVLILETKEGVLVRRGRRTLRGLLKGKVDSAAAEREIRRLRSEWKL